MKKNIIVEESEKNRILELHTQKGYKSLNIYNLLKEQTVQGTKKVQDTSGCPIGNTEQVKKFQDWLDVKVKGWHDKYPNGLQKNTQLGYGMCGPRTKRAWQKYKNIYSQGIDKVKTDTTSTGKVNLNDVNCIAVTTDTCTKINSDKEVTIGSGKNEGCSKWAIRCLSQYNEDIVKGHAWSLLPRLKSSGGKEKYNMFTSLDWNQIRNLIKSNKINKTECELYKNGEEEHLDHKYPKVGKLVSNIYPNQSSVNLNSLELGDVVGLYWKNSSNKGRAFCERALDFGLDQNGNFSTPKPFSFNSHVGFVGAIKNGKPIIFHNVDGTYYATPADEFLSKDAKAMITWAVSDPTVNQKLVKKTKEAEKSWYEKVLDKIGFS